MILIPWNFPSSIQFGIKRSCLIPLQPCMQSLIQLVGALQRGAGGFPDSVLSEKDIPEIHSLVDWIYDEWKSGKKVLVRCQAGWNRSGICVALTLMKDGYKAKDAIDLIRARRSPHALCNEDFVRYLEDLSRTKRPSAQSKSG